MTNDQNRIQETNDGKFSYTDARGNVKTFNTRQEAEAAIRSEQSGQPGVTGTQNLGGGGQPR